MGEQIILEGIQNIGTENLEERYFNYPYRNFSGKYHISDIDGHFLGFGNRDEIASKIVVLGGDGLTKDSAMMIPSLRDPVGYVPFFREYAIQNGSIYFTFLFMTIGVFLEDSKNITNIRLIKREPNTTGIMTDEEYIQFQDNHFKNLELLFKAIEEV